VLDDADTFFIGLLTRAEDLHRDADKAQLGEGAGSEIGAADVSRPTHMGEQVEDLGGSTSATMLDRRRLSVSICTAYA
jgi:hypothetical protein